MNDVEGVRNLIGTGLVELSGGLLTASLAFAVMLRLSAPVTLLTLVALVAFALVVLPSRQAAAARSSASAARSTRRSPAA